MPPGMVCHDLRCCVAGQYRGRLDVPSITRALCAGFSEAAEPDMCLSGSLQARPPSACDPVCCRMRCQHVQQWHVEAAGWSHWGLQGGA